MSMPTDLIAELERLAAAATPTPWKAGSKSVHAEETEDRLGMDLRLFGGNAHDNRANAALIVAAINSLPRLLAVWRAAEKAESALAEISAMYVRTWDREDGALVMMPDTIPRFEAAHDALFPECLRSELHSVRATIEAYSRSAQMQGLAEGSAIGYDLRDKTGGYPALVRVKASGRVVDYKLDRWD